MLSSKLQHVENTFITRSYHVHKNTALWLQTCFSSLEAVLTEKGHADLGHCVHAAIGVTSIPWNQYTQQVRRRKSHCSATDPSQVEMRLKDTVSWTPTKIRRRQQFSKLELKLEMYRQVGSGGEH